MPRKMELNVVLHIHTFLQTHSQEKIRKREKSLVFQVNHLLDLFLFQTCSLYTILRFIRTERVSIRSISAVHPSIRSQRARVLC